MWLNDLIRPRLRHAGGSHAGGLPERWVSSRVLLSCLGCRGRGFFSGQLPGSKCQASVGEQAFPDRWECRLRG